jgi:hypothetical protein
MEIHKSIMPQALRMVEALERMNPRRYNTSNSLPSALCSRPENLHKLPRGWPWYIRGYHCGSDVLRAGCHLGRPIRPDVDQCRQLPGCRCCVIQQQPRRIRQTTTTAKF